MQACPQRSPTSSSSPIFGSSWRRWKTRYRARQDMPFDALTQFYEVPASRLAAIMAHLDGFGSDTLPSAEVRLYRVALWLVEAALSD